MDIRNLLSNATSGIRNGYDSGMSSLLHQLGLEPRRSAMDVALPSVALFAAGLAVGAMAGVLFAPKRGEVLRHDLKDRFEDIKDRSAKKVEQLVHSTEGVIDTIEEKAGQFAANKDGNKDGNKRDGQMRPRA